MGLCESTPSAEHPRAPCAMHRAVSLMGPWESSPPRRIHGHPRRCAGRKRSKGYGCTPLPRASTRILSAAQVGVAHWSMWEHPQLRAPAGLLCAAQEGVAHWSTGEHPIYGPWVSILCAALVASAHGPAGELPVYEHPRAPCGLHMQESLMGPLKSTPCTSTHEHPARCAGRNISWTRV